MYNLCIWKLLSILIFEFLLSNSNVNGNHYGAGGAGYQPDSDAYAQADVQHPYTQHYDTSSYQHQAMQHSAPYNYASSGVSYQHSSGKYTAPSLVPLMRFYSATDADHLYTIDRSQAASLSGYVSEGVTCMVYAQPQNNTLPVFSLYSFEFTSSVYTSSSAISAALVNSGYIPLGIGFYCLEKPYAGTAAIFIYAKVDTADFFFTANPNEIGSGQSAGYVFIGILCYCYPQPTYYAPPADHGYGYMPTY